MQKSRENELKQLETEKIKKENPQPKVNKSDEEITPSGIINQKNMIEQASNMISFEKMNSMKEDRDRKFEQKLAELAKEREEYKRVVEQRDRMTGSVVGYTEVITNQERVDEIDESLKELENKLKAIEQVGTQAKAKVQLILNSRYDLSTINY